MTFGQDHDSDLRRRILIGDLPKNFIYQRMLGSGSYGVVAAFKIGNAGSTVAVKKINDVFKDPLTTRRSLREIKILRHFTHDNITRLLDVLPLRPGGTDLHLIMELMDTDLERILSQSRPSQSNTILSKEHRHYLLSPDNIKSFAYQMLNGCRWLHLANIIHRDLKPGNIFIRAERNAHVLKIGDLGLGRGFDDKWDEEEPVFRKRMTEYVVTRWYRAPEVLLIVDGYDTKIDIWSVGCIIYEMLALTVLFRGVNPDGQLRKIFAAIALSEKEKEDIARRHKSPALQETNYRDSQSIGQRVCGLSLFNQENNDKMRACGHLYVDLLTGMLTYDPEMRLSADEAMQHSLFKEMCPYDRRVAPPVMDFSYDEQFGPNENKDPVDAARVSHLLKAELLKEVNERRSLYKHRMNGDASGPRTAPLDARSPLLDARHGRPAAKPSAPFTLQKSGRGWGSCDNLRHHTDAHHTHRSTQDLDTTTRVFHVPTTTQDIDATTHVHYVPMSTQNIEDTTRHQSIPLSTQDIDQAVSNRCFSTWTPASQTSIPERQLAASIMAGENYNRDIPPLRQSDRQPELRGPRARLFGSTPSYKSPECDIMARIGPAAVPRPLAQPSLMSSLAPPNGHRNSYIECEHDRVVDYAQRAGLQPTTAASHCEPSNVTPDPRFSVPNLIGRNAFADTINPNGHLYGHDEEYWATSFVGPPKPGPPDLRSSNSCTRSDFESSQNTPMLHKNTETGPPRIPVTDPQGQPRRDTGVARLNWELPCDDVRYPYGTTATTPRKEFASNDDLSTYSASAKPRTVASSLPDRSLQPSSSNTRREGSQNYSAQRSCSVFVKPKTGMYPLPSAIKRFIV